MGVASWSCVVRAVDGSGPAGVLALAEGWVTVLSCTVVRGGWLPGAWCRKHARCGGLLRPCGRGGLLVVGAPACWWGWHAVGVLGQCALVA